LCSTLAMKKSEHSRAQCPGFSLMCL
jgi:hypothetical protein